MLDGLYFAGCLGLSATDRLGLLMVLEALRDTHAETAVHQHAVQRATSAPVEVACFLLPEVLGLARSTSETPARAATQCVADTAARLSPCCGDAFVAWFDQAPIEDLLRLLRQAAEEARELSPNARPYVEEAHDVAFVMSLVADRAEESQRREQDEAEASNDILATYATGTFGRLTQLAAYRYLVAVLPARSRPALARGVLTRNGDGTAAQPDLLRIAARIRFPLENLAEISTVRLELTTCAWLMDLMTGRPGILSGVHSSFEVLGLLPGTSTQVATAALWQSVVADLVSELAPEIALGALRPLWVPQPWRTLSVRRHDLASMSGGFHHHLFALGAADEVPPVERGADADVAKSQGAAWAWAASPFLQRGRRPDAPLPAVMRGPAVLRVLSSAVVCARLLRAQLAIDGSAIPELVLHVAAVTRNRNLRLDVGRGDRLPLGQRALVEFAQQLTDRIGRGAEPAIDPVIFFRRYRQNLSHSNKGRQEAARNSRWTLVAWVESALANAVAGSDSGRWLLATDGPSPAEALLLDATQERRRGQVTTNATRAAALVRTYLPSVAIDESPWDWRQERQSPHAWLNLLAFDPHDAADWARVVADALPGSDDRDNEQRRRQRRFFALVAALGRFASASLGDELREAAAVLRLELGRGHYAEEPASHAAPATHASARGRGRRSRGRDRRHSHRDRPDAGRIGPWQHARPTRSHAGRRAAIDGLARRQ